MCASGKSDPVIVRIVGIVIAVTALERGMDVVLRSALPNGFAQSRKLLQAVSVNSSSRSYYA